MSSEKDVQRNHGYERSEKNYYGIIHLLPYILTVKLVNLHIIFTKFHTKEKNVTDRSDVQCY